MHKTPLLDLLKYLLYFDNIQHLKQCKEITLKQIAILLNNAQQILPVIIKRRINMKKTFILQQQEISFVKNTFTQKLN